MAYDFRYDLNFRECTAFDATRINSIMREAWPDEPLERNAPYWASTFSNPYSIQHGYLIEINNNKNIIAGFVIYKYKKKKEINRESSVSKWKIHAGVLSEENYSITKVTKPKKNQIEITATVHITDFAIAKKYRGKGIGTTLLYETILSFPPYTQFILEVKTNNVAAINLYKKCRFQKTRKLRNYYGYGKHADEMKLISSSSLDYDRLSKYFVEPKVSIKQKYTLNIDIMDRFGLLSYNIKSYTFDIDSPQILRIRLCQILLKSSQYHKLILIPNQMALSPIEMILGFEIFINTNKLKILWDQLLIILQDLNLLVDHVTHVVDYKYNKFTFETYNFWIIVSILLMNRLMIRYILSKSRLWKLLFIFFIHIDDDASDFCFKMMMKSKGYQKKHLRFMLKLKECSSEKRKKKINKIQKGKKISLNFPECGWIKCNRKVSKRNICKGCCLMYYCCRNHQKKDWRFIHSQQCLRKHDC